jgi:hypothetical protein
LVELSCFPYFYGNGSQSCQYAEGFTQHRAVCTCNFNIYKPLYSYGLWFLAATFYGFYPHELHIRGEVKLPLFILFSGPRTSAPKLLFRISKE